MSALVFGSVEMLGLGHVRQSPIARTSNLEPLPVLICVIIQICGSFHLLVSEEAASARRNGEEPVHRFRRLTQIKKGWVKAS